MSRINLIINSHWYHDIQMSSTSLNHMIRSKAAPGRDKRSQGMIRTQGVNWTPIIDCTKDDGKTAVQITSDDMVMGAVWALCEISLLVSQPNNSDLSLTVLDNALKWWYKKKGAFREKKISKCVKAKVDEQLAWESPPLWAQKIHEIWPAMEVQVYGAEMGTTTKRTQFQLPWIQPDNWQPNGQMLISSRQKSDWSKPSIRWHLKNATFVIHHSNIIRDNYCRKSGPRQQVLDAHLPKHLLKR